MIKRLRMTFNPATIGTRNSTQFIRSVAAFGLVAGIGLFGLVHPTAAALDHDARRGALVNHHSNLSDRPRVVQQGHASKDALRASEYATLRQQHNSSAASTTGSRVFFR